MRIFRLGQTPGCINEDIPIGIASVDVAIAILMLLDPDES